MFSLIIAAGGKGSRANLNYNKLFFEQNGVAVLKKTFDAFYSTGLFSEFIVAVSPDDLERAKACLPSQIKFVLGGATRSLSVYNALKEVTLDSVLIHDGARPYIDDETIKAVCDSVTQYGSGITAVPSVNTTCIAVDGVISKNLGKDGLYVIQTPQGFRTKDILSAFEKSVDVDYPDESSRYGDYIDKPRIVLGKPSNIKLTYKEDFISDIASDYRFGVGYDTHKLVPDRKLILGGVTIPHDKGLLGHSDADVLTHAIMDAMLSALSLRDIGYHFSDKDQQYKDISSMVLLGRVLEMVKEKGYTVNNISATVMAQKPKLLPHIPAVTENLARELGVNISQVGIGATTTEGLGFVGREEGIAVYATACLKKI